MCHDGVSRHDCDDATSHRRVPLVLSTQVPAENFVIVTHGVAIRVFLMRYLKVRKKNRVGAPSSVGIITNQVLGGDLTRRAYGSLGLHNNQPNGEPVIVTTSCSTPRLRQCRSSRNRRARRRLARSITIDRSRPIDRLLDRTNPSILDRSIHRIDRSNSID